MIHVVVGTKAQLIKMAPVMKRMDGEGAPYRFILTGQHRNTMDELQEGFGLKDPDATLYEGRDVTGVFQMTGWLALTLSQALTRKRRVFGRRKAGVVVVHGDTFSTLLGALMGRLAGLKVAHVESGLRSFDLSNPFPEEITRLLVFRLSDVYFCPGQWAVDNLRRYGGRKVDTGANTLYDALALALENLDRVRVEVPPTPYGLVSLHRFENIFRRERLVEICGLLEEAAEAIPLLFILHLPTLQQLRKFSLYERLERSPNIELRPRYDYFRFVKLLQGAELLITDGGSNQEEAYYLGKPTLLMRQATERREGLGENVVLSRYDARAVREFARGYRRFGRPPKTVEPSPSRVIVECLKTFCR